MSWLIAMINSSYGWLIECLGIGVNFKSEYNGNTFSVMKNSIIETSFENPTPMFLGDEIIWILNDNISAKFICHDNHSSFTDIHNVSALRPQDCEIYVNSPFIFIKAILNVLISDETEEIKYMPIWKGLSSRKLFLIVKTKYDLKIIKIGKKLLDDTNVEDNEIRWIADQSWWYKLNNNFLTVIMFAGLFIALMFIAVCICCVFKKQIV